MFITADIDIFQFVWQSLNEVCLSLNITFIHSSFSRVDVFCVFYPMSPSYKDGLNYS